MVIYIYPFDRS